jgi:hypothetical protein
VILPGGLGPAQAWTLAREMGPRWMAGRGAHALQQRMGLLERRFPARGWEAFRLAEVARSGSVEADPERFLASFQVGSGRRFFVAPADRPRLREGLRRLLFQVERERLGGVAAAAGVPDWHRHPKTGEVWPLEPWTRLADFGGADVKALWEPARFAVAYDLVRATWIVAAPGAAEAFWRLVESFRETNPPGLGVHWMCGQECAVRVLAWCFALHAFADDPATTPERAGRLLEMLAAHGARIEANLSFALSQKNNHGINEALGLWTLGLLFPGLLEAERWERRGRTLLEREGLRQIYPDGSYVQHSLNYHRLILQSYAWALRLGDLAGRPFSRALRERVGRAARLLLALTDRESGRAPNYGANDGSRLYVLDGCGFADQRPALGAALWLAPCLGEKRRALPPGPWDEALLWLCGEEPLAAPVQEIPPDDLDAREGGYFTIRNGGSWAFTRCATYRDRPAQADLLHVDLWWRGANVLADPGTYSYDAPPPWNNGLAGTAVHNAPTVDGRDQMERGPRFLWLGWPHGRLRRRVASPDGLLRLLEAEHDGYLSRLGVRHRRTLLAAGEDLWLIVDDLHGEGTHDLSWCWLLPAAATWTSGDDEACADLPPGRVHLSFSTWTSSGERLSAPLQAVHGESPGPHGWYSPTYHDKQPALALLRSQRAPLPVRSILAVALGFDPVLEVGPHALAVEGPGGRLEAAFSPLDGSARPALRSAALHRPGHPASGLSPAAGRLQS